MAGELRDGVAHVMRVVVDPPPDEQHEWLRRTAKHRAVANGEA